MATPGAQRAVAGVTLVERLSVGLYGELWRAQGGRKDVRALVVDGKLAVEPGFASALMDDSRDLVTSVHHRNVVGTAQIARDGQRLVVVTEPVLGGASLHDLLAEARGKGGKLDPRRAAAIARAVVDGLATVHALGLVHGAIHPRSVLIDADGAVRLADLAVGRALALTLARSADGGSGLARGLAGYLAPELALGEDPSPATDVYAVGALLFTMLTGETPPGTVTLSPAMDRLIHRALDTELARRFASAVELQENLAEALDDDRWEVASQLDLARWVQESRVATAANLDEATEDLLASLADAVSEPTTRAPTGVGPEPGTATGVTTLGTGGHDTGGSHLDSVLADLDDGGDSGDAFTQVDPTRHSVVRDPVSALIALDPHALPTRVSEPPLEIKSTRRGSPGREADRTDSTPLPAPVPDEPGTITRSGDQVAETGRHKLVERAAMDALAGLDASGEHDAVAPPPAAKPAPAQAAAPAKSKAAAAPAAEPAAPRAAAAVPMPAPDEPPPSLGRSSAMTWVWVVVILGLAGVLVWVVEHSNEVNQANKEAHDQEAAASRKAAADKTAELTAELPDPGGIRVTSNPDGAAVWLMLGRTPLDSMGLPSNMVHELRLELDGYAATDLDVGGKDWSTVGSAKIARVARALTAADGKTAPLPAIPPKPDAALSQGLPEGRGILHVESTPPGAAVWLLVGITPNMDLEGIEAGRDYDLKVVKDGFLPGYVHVTAESWRDGGDPRLPLSAAPKKAVMEPPEVTLQPQPKGKGK